MLSVMIITKNEESNIRNCLESVKWAGEIIIVDSGSTDKTVEICKEYTHHITVTNFPGFGPQKNRALANCTGHWVLSLDADETLSPDLQKEIQAIVEANLDQDAYTIRRISSYCGKVIKWGDWRNDLSTRLFKRSKGKFSEDLVHEKLIIDGLTSTLKAPLFHNAFANYEQVLHKMNFYSTLGAKTKLKQGKKGGLIRALIHAGWTFARGFGLRFGFLDGFHGFMLAVSNAEGTYYKYLKLGLMTPQKTQPTKPVS